MRVLFCAALAVLLLGALDRRAADTDRYLTSMAHLGRFNGVVLVAQNGHVTLRKGYGYADFAAKRPNTPQTQFAIASLTKMFTAMAVLKLRDSSKLALGDSICKYLSPCPSAWAAATIDETLHHRAGIPDYESALDIESPAYMAFMSAPNTVDRILDREERLPLDFTPGTKFSYSNTGYIVLAKIVERVSGMPFGTMLDRRIFAPAQMTQTGVFGTDVPANLAPAFRKELSWSQRLPGVDLAAMNPEPVPLVNVSQAGDGGVFSTVDDIYRWTQLTQGSALVPASEAAEVFAPVDGYGMGWMIGEDVGLKRYRHTGELPGYLSDVRIYPDDHLTIVMLSNFEENMRAVTRGASLAALGKPFDMPVSGTMIQLSEAAKSSLTGAYAFADGKIACVSNAPQFLTVSVKGQYSAGLIPLSPERFYMPLSDGTVTFTLRDGKSAGFTMRYDAIDHRATRTASACT